MEDESYQTSRNAFRQRLESLERSGIRQLKKMRPAQKNAPTLGVLPEGDGAGRDEVRQLDHGGIRKKLPAEIDGQDHSSPPNQLAKPPLRDRPMNMESNDEKQSALQIVQQDVAQCTACAELASARTQTVFGVGNPNARLCFLGEAPGADEDRQGEPFVGRAGQLLTKIIEACKIKREDVYILNILKCRPPGNRNPSPIESENCSGFLHRQLEIIQPEYIVCLGSIAATNLLDTKVPIGKLRGEFHLYRGIKVLATYHPAYLLRNPSAKKQVWEDIKFLMNDMGIEISQ